MSGQLMAVNTCRMIAGTFLSLSAQTASLAPTAMELLDRYTKALDSLQSVIVTEQGVRESYHKIGDALGQKISGQPMKTYFRNEFRSDGQRHCLRTYKWGNVGSASKLIPEDRPSYLSMYWDGEQYYSHSAIINQPQPGYGTFKKGPAARAEAQTAISVTAEPTSGYVRGYSGASRERLDTIVRRARQVSVRDKTESVNGCECYVLDATTDSGRMSLWLDPTHNYHLAKATIKLGPGGLWLGKPLGKGANFTVSLESVRFAQVNGLWVPMGSESTQDLQSPRGEFSTSKLHYERTEVVVNPDHEALGSFRPENDPELKNGTLFHIPGDTRKYLWQDGKLVPESSGSRANRPNLRSGGRR
jgi:hypothetical protein